MASKSSNTEPNGSNGTAEKCIENFSRFIYNSEKGEICSKKPLAWLFIILYHLIFYAILAAFWVGMFQLFSLSVANGRPTWEGEKSILENSPSLSFRPESAPTLQTKSDLILVRNSWRGTGVVTEDSDVGQALRVKLFLTETLIEGQPNAVECSDEELNVPRPETNSTCKIDPNIFGPCADFPYGYGKNPSPCVFVKLNKIFGFQPRPLDADGVNLLDNFPEQLLPYILDSDEPRRVYINCEGHDNHDKAAIEGKLQYYPQHQGIPMGFFPHKDRTNLASPMVAVQFNNIPKNQIINVQCKVWYDGVIHDGGDRKGLVNFAILIEDQKD